MVFFTSILIVLILYYLQADGLVYVTIIALTAELINIFMTHTLTKSVEKKMNIKFRRVLEGYKLRIKNNKKTIKELEKLQGEAGEKLYKANTKIKEFEEELALYKEGETALYEADADEKKAIPPSPLESTPPAIPPKKATPGYNDLPTGSNRGGTSN
jgi:hypothetical protein